MGLARFLESYEIPLLLSFSQETGKALNAIDTSSSYTISANTFFAYCI